MTSVEAIGTSIGSMGMNMAAQEKHPDHALDAIDMGVLAGSLGPIVRLLRNHLAGRIITAFERFGLRTGSFSTMALIAANPGCSQADIARETGMDKSVVVGLVDALEARGLAERARSTRDRRRNVLTLTGAGLDLLDEMHHAALAVERPIRTVLTEAEVETLIRLNRKALSALVEGE